MNMGERNSPVLSGAEMNEPDKNSGTNGFRFAAQFCFPRLSGTRGETEAQAKALGEFISDLEQ